MSCLLESQLFYDPREIIPKRSFEDSSWTRKSQYGTAQIMISSHKKETFQSNKPQTSWTWAHFALQFAMARCPRRRRVFPILNWRNMDQTTSLKNCTSFVFLFRMSTMSILKSPCLVLEPWSYTTNVHAATQSRSWLVGSLPTFIPSPTMGVCM